MGVAYGNEFGHHVGAAGSLYGVDSIAAGDKGFAVDFADAVQQTCVAVTEKHHVVAMQRCVGSEWGKEKVVAAFLQKRVHAYAGEGDFNGLAAAKAVEHKGEKVVVGYGPDFRHGVLL